jgi:hypothetical protein
MLNDSTQDTNNSVQSTNDFAQNPNESHNVSGENIPRYKKVFFEFCQKICESEFERTNQMHLRSTVLISLFSALCVAAWSVYSSHLKIRFFRNTRHVFYP